MVDERFSEELISGVHNDQVNSGLPIITQLLAIASWPHDANPVTLLTGCVAAADLLRVECFLHEVSLVIV